MPSKVFIYAASRQIEWLQLPFLGKKGLARGLRNFGTDGVHGYFLQRPNPDYRRAERAGMNPVTGANSVSADTLLH